MGFDPRLLRSRAVRRSLGPAVTRQLHQQYPGMVPDEEVEPLLADWRIEGIRLQESHALSFRQWTLPQEDLPPGVRVNDRIYFCHPTYPHATTYQRTDIRNWVYIVLCIEQQDESVCVHIRNVASVSEPTLLHRKLFGG